MANKLIIHSEKVAYWYLRLNGFLTIVNFIVHSEDPNRYIQETEVDILGVRFPFRSEMIGTPMVDDKVLTDLQPDDKVLTLIVDVKASGACKFNSTWTDATRANIQRVLRALGAIKSEQIESAAASLYGSGTWSDNLNVICLASIAPRINPQMSLHDSLQLTWSKILEFIFERFVEYREEKNHHPQWDYAGQVLFEFSKDKKNSREFVNSIQIVDQATIEIVE